jgi:hypothetical protein
MERGEGFPLPTKYVEEIGYDEYGQRIYIKYGNGVETEYSYDENRRWLDSIKTQTENRRLHQNMKYQFDAAGNVSGYENAADGYTTQQSYSDDDVHGWTNTGRGTDAGRPVRALSACKSGRNICKQAARIHRLHKPLLAKLCIFTDRQCFEQNKQCEKHTG